MQGKLHHTEQGWSVTYITSRPHEQYGRQVYIAEAAVHSDCISALEQTYVSDEYETVYIYNGRNVEFQLVGGFAKLM